jgi:tight adherence protein B
VNTGLLIVVALALLLLAGAVWLLNRAQTQERGEDVRLRLRVSGTEEAPAVALIRDIRNPLVRWICRLFWRTGTEIRPNAVWQMLFGIAGVLVILALTVGLLTSLVVTGAAIIVFYMVLSQRASRRRLKIVDQMPGFLENVIRVLAAGNTFEESLVQAARESPDPIRPLFASIGRQVRLGAPIEQVLAESGDIYRLRDLKVISLAASINRKYGGSMRSVLKSLIVAIRQRANAAKELRALTAETRFSAYVLAGLTIGLFVYLYLSNRAYYGSMLATTGGTIMLGLSGGMVFTGFIVLWRMVKSIDEDDT